LFGHIVTKPTAGATREYYGNVQGFKVSGFKIQISDWRELWFIVNYSLLIIHYSLNSTCFAIAMFVL
jgi:hypothetical protein